MKSSYQKTKVMFVMPKMGVGGIERIRLNLLKEFKQKDILCTLAVAKPEGDLLNSAKELATTHIFSPKNISGFVPSLSRLIKEEKPSHIITAFEDVGFLTFLAIKLSGVKVTWIHSVHNTHSIEGQPKNLKGRFFYLAEYLLGKFYYKHTDKIVAVSEGVRQEIINGYNTPSDKVITIYNPAVSAADCEFIRENTKKRPSDTWQLISVGRLHHQKGYDILIKSLKNLSGNWTLEIWGEGPERNNLEALIKKLQLENKIRLKGYTSNPLEKMRRADIFILSSRHEGLGNVLIEAMASQCQLIATNCKHGPSEILDNGKYGQLVPVGDSYALTQAINNIFIGKKTVPEIELRMQALDFSVENNINKWAALI